MKQQIAKSLEKKQACGQSICKNALFKLVFALKKWQQLGDSFKNRQTIGVLTNFFFSIDSTLKRSLDQAFLSKSDSCRKVQSAQVLSGSLIAHIQALYKQFIDSLKLRQREESQRQLSSAHGRRELSSFIKGRNNL